MRLTPGVRLGPYEVLSALGSGGMAEVYRARDTRLGRDIAIKVVNDALAADPELLRRFEQEARLAGSLNHPNLVAVYDVGLHEGVPYFITELLQGESLRHRLARGRIPVDSALDWAAQLAEGLAAAHARGIIHRDVKPENVFVSSDGHVKLLDFGIAKLSEANPPLAARGILDETVTPTGHGTQTGAILGTPAYMSPEQVRGERVDPRTDVFSLGAVLHEMLSGQRPFSGESTLERAHAVVHDDPAPLSNVPPLVAQVVRRCLAKDPDARFQSARDLAFNLAMLRSDAEPRPTSGSRSPPTLVRRMWWVLPAMAALVGAGVLLSRLQASPPALAPMTVETVTFRPALVRGARFTADRRVVFGAKEGRSEELFERNLTATAIQPLGLRNMALAAVSPKGEFAVFLPPFNGLNRLSSGPLARVSTGGTPRQVAENIVGADWSPSGDLAVIRREGLFHSVEFPVGKVLFKTTGQAWLGDVRVSPRGDLLAFIHHSTSGNLAGEVLVVDLEGRTRRSSRSWARVTGVGWSPHNEVWYGAGDRLPNQIQALPIAGAERTLYTSLIPFSLCDVASDGSALVFQAWLRQDIAFLADGAPSARSLSWSDRTWGPLLSADARQVMFSAYGPRNEALTLLRRVDGSPPQFLGEGIGMDLSPDGRWALVEVEDGLSAVPTGTGTSRTVSLPGFLFGAGRWLGGTRRALTVARSEKDSGARLYSVDMEQGTTTVLSEPGLDFAHLEVSPGQEWAVTLDIAWRPVLHSLAGGKPVSLTEIEAGLAPAGWAARNELWFARMDDTGPTVVRLLRFDVRRRVKLEERSVSLSLENGSTGDISSIHVTPDGKNMVFSQSSYTGHLYVIRGLDGVAR